MHIGIIGYGHVGQAMSKLFPDAVIYDKYQNINYPAIINLCDIAFICVPTPMAEDGSCDTKEVEEVISWCTCKCIVIRSTVPIGFTERMSKKYKKELVFQPEYYGETANHPFADLSKQNWLIFGGNKSGINMAIEAYQTVRDANVSIYTCTSGEAEMAKYMENAFLATKVVFCNEMYDVCTAYGLDYNVVRELWTADPRIGKSHTFVYKNNRGYSGSCLPKDIQALYVQGKEQNVDMTLTEAVIERNKTLRGK